MTNDERRRLKNLSVRWAADAARERPVNPSVAAALDLCAVELRSALLSLEDDEQGEFRARVGQVRS